MNVPFRKPDGYIPPKGPHETETLIKLTIGNKSLKLVKYESAREISFYIGGHTIYCIYASLYKDNGIVISVGSLNKIRYDQVCSLENNFMRGIDTNMILKLLLSYISRNYPTVKQLSFNDTSSRPCDNGESVNLAFMSYLLHGKTWYENHFGAFLEKRDLTTFNKYESDFQNRKKMTTWESFIIQMHKILQMPIHENELKELYTQSATWHEFFKTIHNRLDISEFCVHVQPWLDRFMNLYFKLNLIGLQYQMPVKDYGVNYIEGTYQRGGRKYTRRVGR
jgi:hypothetical protein